MSVERFQERLEAGLARLQREQRNRAWSFVAGLIAAVFAFGLSASLPDIGLPDTRDEFLYLIWTLAAWFGAASLLAFGIESAPSRRAERQMLAGLWSGAVAVAAGAAAMPLVLILALVPIAVGASIVRRLNGSIYAALYIAVPLVAVMLSSIYQHYESSAT